LIGTHFILYECFVLVYIMCCRYAPLSEPVLAEPILFGDFATILDSTDADAPPPRLYRDVGSYSTLQPLFESLLAAYNAKHKPMQLVFFDDAMEHLTRIIRILRLPMVSGLCPRCLAALFEYPLDEQLCHGAC
jgi:hypothetical protein